MMLNYRLIQQLKEKSNKPLDNLQIGSYLRNLLKVGEIYPDLVNLPPMPLEAPFYAKGEGVSRNLMLRTKEGYYFDFLEVCNKLKIRLLGEKPFTLFERKETSIFPRVITLDEYPEWLFIRVKDEEITPGTLVYWDYETEDGQEDISKSNLHYIIQVCLESHKFWTIQPSRMDIASFRLPDQTVLFFKPYHLG